MFQVKSRQVEDTRRLADTLAKVLREGMVICLSGDLGAGKTLFVQALGRAMGVEEEITSPTFNLMNVYQGKMRIYHFDLYRLEAEEELEGIGFFDYVGDENAIKVIEWADKFSDSLPEDYIKMDIIKEDENTRLINFSLIGREFLSVYEEMKELCQF